MASDSFHIVHSVHCELNYKFYQHQQMHNSIYCVILLLICSYMLRLNRRLQGANTNVVKTYSHKDYFIVVHETVNICYKK